MPFMEDVVDRDLSPCWHYTLRKGYGGGLESKTASQNSNKSTEKHVDPSPVDVSGGWTSS